MKGKCIFILTINIVDPSPMSLDGIRREANQFHAPLLKLGLVLCQGGKLGGAYGSIVFGVREKNCPFVANPLVEIDVADRRLRLEVWGRRS